MQLLKLTDAAKIREGTCYYLARLGLGASGGVEGSAEARKRPHP